MAEVYSENAGRKSPMTWVVLAVLAVIALVIIMFVMR